MKWVLAIGILAMMVVVLGVGIVGFTTHYCMPPIGHITPMLCKVPIPPMPIKPMPIPHPNYH